ncbi:hypothetical protein [uncultured Anaerofustis sp.]|uniref:hypothetical protein n=1 Tax=uncultured Anaerofustis sp. TaxID=904996 RepID=UPI0025F6DC05|nr:hypothetical protein [uncultured Anaerofustis sp.]
MAIKKRVRKVAKKPRKKEDIFEDFNFNNIDQNDDNDIDIDYSDNDIFKNIDFEKRIKSDTKTNQVLNDAEPKENQVIENNNEDEFFEEEEIENIPLREALKFKITGKTIGIFVGILIAAFALGFTLSKVFPGGKVFYSVVNLSDVITDGKVECTVSDIVVTDTLSSVKASNGNTFVCIYYEYKNISDEDLKWEQLPFTTLGGYDTDKPGLTPDYELSNDSINKDALREYSYIMGVDLRDDLDPLNPGQSRDDVDVYEIKKSALTDKKIYLTFDIYDKAIKVEEGLSTLPSLKETIKENKQEIKKEQETVGITNN